MTFIRLKITLILFDRLTLLVYKESLRNARAKHVEITNGDLYFFMRFSILQRLVRISKKITPSFI